MSSLDLRQQHAEALLCKSQLMWCTHHLPVCESGISHTRLHPQVRARDHATAVSWPRTAPVGRIVTVALLDAIGCGRKTAICGGHACAAAAAASAAASAAATAVAAE